MNVAETDSPPPKLLADIGGTNARFVLLEANGEFEQPRNLRCEDFPDLVSAVRAYLDSVEPRQRPETAAFAFAAPVRGERISFTNRAWSFSLQDIRRRLRLKRLAVVNDFAAVAMAAPRLGAGDLLQVGGGASVADAPIAVIGPGTGLGVSGLMPVKSGWVPLTSEGGHVTLAPASDRESEVLSVLRRKFDHVSAERLLSGPGLVNLCAALAELEGRSSPPAATPDEVARLGLEKSCGLCEESLDMFCAMLGTVASNLALSLGARGGVYIAGGIIPRLGGCFAESPFRARFEDKGRFSAYMSDIPTWVITHDAPAFLGLKAFLEDR